jgi:hypothetical protein
VGNLTSRFRTDRRENDWLRRTDLQPRQEVIHPTLSDRVFQGSSLVLPMYPQPSLLAFQILLAGERTKRERRVLPLNYRPKIGLTGVEPATSRLRAEVSLLYTARKPCFDVVDRPVGNHVWENGRIRSVFLCQEVSVSCTAHTASDNPGENRRERRLV